MSFHAHYVPDQLVVALLTLGYSNPTGVVQYASKKADGTIVNDVKPYQVGIPNDFDNRSINLGGDELFRLDKNGNWALRAIGPTWELASDTRQETERKHLAIWNKWFDLSQGLLLSFTLPEHLVNMLDLCAYEAYTYRQSASMIQMTRLQSFLDTVAFLPYLYPRHYIIKEGGASRLRFTPFPLCQGQLLCDLTRAFSKNRWLNHSSAECFDSIVRCAENPLVDQIPILFRIDYTSCTSLYLLCTPSYYDVSTPDLYEHSDDIHPFAIIDIDKRNCTQKDQKILRERSLKRIRDTASYTDRIIFDLTSDSEDENHNDSIYSNTTDSNY
jgi:hypothetical protein